MGSLRVLPHGVPRQRDGCEVLLSDRISAASPTEAGSTVRGDSRQGLRTTERAGLPGALHMGGLVRPTEDADAAGVRGPSRRNG
jgi:hypothetical protein